MLFSWYDMGAAKGLTHYHTKGLIIPLLAAISPMWLSRCAIDGVSTPVNAIIAGCIVGIATYIGYVLLEESKPFAKAALCGLLVAEVMVMKTSTKLPSMAGITLWLFFYYHTVEH